MKKIMWIGVAVLVFVSALFSGQHVAAAGLITYAGGHYVWGKGIVFVFDAAGYRNRDVRDASLFVGSNFHDLHCTVDQEQEQIICVAGGRLTQFVRQTGIVHLGGQIFYVEIPGKPTPPEPVFVEPPLVCEEPEVLGASVLFRDSDGVTFSEFVPGDTIEEVEARADLWVDGVFWVWHGPVHELECGMPPQ